MWRLLMRHLARKWGILSFAQSSSRANRLLSFPSSSSWADISWSDMILNTRYYCEAGRVAVQKALIVMFLFSSEGWVAKKHPRFSQRKDLVFLDVPVMQGMIALRSIGLLTRNMLRHVSCCWSLVHKWMMKMMMPGDSDRFGQMLSESYIESLRPGRLCAWRQRRDMKRSCSIYISL